MLVHHQFTRETSIRGIIEDQGKTVANTLKDALNLWIILRSHIWALANRGNRQTDGQPLVDSLLLLVTQGTSLTPTADYLEKQQHIFRGLKVKLPHKAWVDDSQTLIEEIQVQLLSQSEDLLKKREFFRILE
jgi:hypothetical protein